MSNLIIFSSIFLVLLLIFIKLIRSFFSQVYLRRKIIKGLRQHKTELYLAKEDKEQLFEIYKRVYNMVIYRKNRLFAPENGRKFEQRAQSELNRMTKNSLTKLYASIIVLLKGVFSLAILLATIFFAAIVVDEVKASSLTLPTINQDMKLKLTVDLEDKIDSIITTLLNGENTMQSFDFQQLANEAVIPVYDVKDYPQAVTNIEQLGQAIAHHMSQFEQQFTVYYKGDAADFEQTIDEVYKWLEVNEPYLWAVMGDFSTRARSLGNTIEWQATVNYDLTAEQNAIVLGKIDQIINMIPQDATEAEKVKFINDYLVVHTKYNVNSKVSPHTPYSVLVNGEGVCEGYALAAFLMFEALDIEAKYVVGHAGAPHAWNLVNVDGQWYHLDITWNDPVPDQGEKVHYHYFLITDEKISNDHEWNTSDYPQSAINSYL